MSRIDLPRWKKGIDEQVGDLLKKRDELLESLSEINLRTPDENEAGTKNETVLIVSAKLENTAERLEKLFNASNRIDEGTFGICEDCGEDISIRRLEVRPESSLCVKCKEAVERKSKHLKK